MDCSTPIHRSIQYCVTNKTTQTTADVASFIAGIGDDQKRSDSEALVKLMQDITGEKPAMWGPSIVGFGTYHYRSASGREGTGSFWASRRASRP